MPPSGGEVNNGDVGGHQPTARKMEEGDLSEIGRAGGSPRNGDPLEAVRSHPRFDAQRRLVQSNPDNIIAVFSQIIAQQPELVHVIMDRDGPGAFIEMMLGPMAFATGVGATGSPAPTGRPAEAKVASNASADESETEEKETVPTKLAAPNGATCYFCLDEGLDESGKPPVRDCSCRGDSAGFAHLSCMIEYAKQKSNQAAGKDFDKFTEPWYHCPNCKQLFKSQLSLDLTSAFVSFADATYGHPGNSYNDKISVMCALRLRIKTIVDLIHQCLANNVNRTTSFELMEGVPVIEGKMLGKKLLAMVEKMTKEDKMESWQYRLVRENYEASLYCFLAMLNTDSAEEAIAFYKKARKVYGILGIKHEANAFQNSIDAIRIIPDTGGSVETKAADTLVEITRKSYERLIEKNGLTAEHVLRYGVAYVNALLRAQRTIEAERLVVKLAADSCRVHGSEHSCTLYADKYVGLCKKRYVVAMPWNKTFQALRYDDDGDICVVKTTEGQLDDEQQDRFTNDLIFPNPGCPVVCHGLVSALHLNGKLGEVKNIVNQPAGTRLEVHFDDKSQKPVFVKPENLRIAFELDEFVDRRDD